MEYTNQENIPGILVFIDFEKAFDSIEWNFIISCLNKFNFGTNFQFTMGCLQGTLNQGEE